MTSSLLVLVKPHHYQGIVTARVRANYFYRNIVPTLWPGFSCLGLVNEINRCSALH